MKTPSLSKSRLPALVALVVGITAGSSFAQQDNHSMLQQAPEKLQQQPQKPQQPKVPNQQVVPEQDRTEQPGTPPQIPNAPVNPPAAVKGITGLKLVPPMKREGGKPSVPRDSAAAQVGESQLPEDPFEWHRNLFRELEGAEQAGQAGEIGEMRGLDDSMVDPDTKMPDLGLGANEGGKFGNPNDVPGSGGQRGDGLAADAPPSGFDTATTGIAGTGGAKVITNPDGSISKTWSEEHEDGSVTEHVSTQHTDGTTSWTDTTNRTTETGLRQTVTREVASDGTRTERHESFLPNGNGGIIEWRRTPDGTVSARNGRQLGGGAAQPSMTPWQAYPRASDRRYMPRHVGGGGADNPGDEPTASQKALANWLMKQHNVGRTGSSGPNDMGVKTNPGDPEYEGATVPGGSLSAAFGDDIAVNPNPEAAGGGGMSDEELRKRSEQMREDAKGPGPMPEPEDGRDNR